MTRVSTVSPLTPCSLSGRPAPSEPREAVEAALEAAYHLRLTPPQLPARYLYDALGSALFEAICRLPWYGIARAEERLLDQAAPEIGDALGDRPSIVELGGGSGAKLARLVGGPATASRPLQVHLVDVSASALEQSADTLGRVPHVSLTLHHATYEDGLEQATAQPSDGTLMVVFLGSNIGNFDPAGARGFLSRIRRAVRPGDLLLLGADLVKPEPELILAYDDPLGVTAAFNKNLLVRLNHELGADFDLAQFTHRAIWNAPYARVEMHLVSRCDQEVGIPRAGFSLHLAAGESIWTESSYKYQPTEVVGMGSAAGFAVRRQWLDAGDRFALTLFEAR